jgi:membrane dipeptidase
MTRLIDLHTDWLLQYAPETNLYNAEQYPNIAGRLAQAEGYLGNTRAAVLSCYRDEKDWAQQTDPWKSLGDLITRLEAEFAGRLLIDRSDWARFESEPGSLTWGVIAVEGFDLLIRDRADLARLAQLHARGVRIYQPIYDTSTLLGGSSRPGDERGLTELGREFLDALLIIGEQPGLATPIVDLAHMNPQSASDTLTWLEANAGRPRDVIPVYSHGALRNDYCPGARALAFENLVRLRKLGGVVGLSVGPPFYDDPARIKQSIEEIAKTPFEGVVGFGGIAIGTDFLGVSRTIPALANSDLVIRWVQSEFDVQTADDLLWRNALNLLRRMLRVSEDTPSAH